MTTFKLIKSSEPFTVPNSTVKHVAHTVAYHGRALNLSTLSFADTPDYKITVDATAKTVKIEGGDISVIQRPYVDAVTNEVRTGLSIMPKFDLAIDAF